MLTIWHLFYAHLKSSIYKGLTYKCSAFFEFWLETVNTYHFAHTNIEYLGLNMHPHRLGTYSCQKCVKNYQSRNEKVCERQPCPSCGTQNYPLTDVSEFNWISKTKLKIAEENGFIIDLMCLNLHILHRWCWNRKKRWDKLQSEQESDHPTERSPFKAFTFQQIAYKSNK